MYRDRSLTVITSFVVIGHAALILWSSVMGSSDLPAIKQKPKQLAVQTVKLKEEALIAAVEAPTKVEEPVKIEEPAPVVVEPLPKEEPPQPKPEPKLKPAPPQPPKPKPAPQKKEVKKIVEKPPAPKPKKEVKAEPQKPSKEEELKRQKLLAQVQQNIEKIERRSDKVGSKSTGLPDLPKRIEKLQIESITTNENRMSGQEVGFRDELASRLRLLLKLPDYGEVKVKLTLNRSGKVSKVEIINTQSTVNKSYIETVLPTLTFAPFGTNFKGLDQYTFMITLTNE
jgi:colicin import membrane protein